MLMSRTLILATLATCAANTYAADCRSQVAVESLVTAACQDAGESSRARWTDPVNNTTDDSTAPDQMLEIRATPVPEPAAAGVLLFAGGTLLLARPVRAHWKGGLAENT